MMCPKCSGAVKVRRTFSVDGGKTQECRCESCNHSFASVTVAFEGMSAYKASKALDQGKMRVKVDTVQASPK